MNIEDLGNIGEFVAALAVLFSLVYLAFQIRQNTKQLRQAAFANVFHGFSNLRRSVYSDVAMSELVVKLRNGDTEFSKAELVRAQNLFAENAFCVMQLWNAIRSGDMDYSESGLQAALEGFSSSLSSPITRNWWFEIRGLFDPLFIEEVESLIEKEDT